MAKHILSILVVTNKLLGFPFPLSLSFNVLIYNIIIDLVLYSLMFCFKVNIIVTISSDKIAVVLHCHFHTGLGKTGFHFILSTHEDAEDAHICSICYSRILIIANK